MHQFSSGAEHQGELLPPSVLYKYLAVARVEDVLATGLVRFTPLNNTNDTFEMRSTFVRVAGPKLRAMFFSGVEEKVSDVIIDRKIKEHLSKVGMEQVPVTVARQWLEAYHGCNLASLLQQSTRDLIDAFAIPMLNDPANHAAFLEMLGSDLLCLSLSARNDSAPMWAHYADNHCGLIIAFWSGHRWFACDRTDRSKLKKVKYFDGVLNEILDDPDIIATSKTTEWSYEDEWRMFAHEGDASKLSMCPDGPVHLFEFPADSVSQVIVGYRASEATIAKVLAACRARYPHAEVMQARPDRREGRFAFEHL